MRNIINWFRSLFCKHEFLFEETYSKYENSMGDSKQGLKVSRTCSKCGWHTSYWKFE